MAHYKKKTFFGNRYSLNKLTKFRDLVKKYFEILNNTPNFPQDRSINNSYFIKGVLPENIEAKNIRSKINNLLDTIEGIVLDADINPSVEYYSQQEQRQKIIPVLSNIFILDGYNIKPDRLLDFIERAIGVYSHDKIQSIARTFDPIFWFIRLLDFIFNVFLGFLKESGFDTRKIEDNFFVKIIKFIFYFVGFIASILTVLSLLGYI